MATMNINIGGEFRTHTELMAYVGGQWVNADGYVYVGGDWEIFTKKLFEVSSVVTSSNTIGISSKDGGYFDVNQSRGKLIKYNENGTTAWEYTISSYYTKSYIFQYDPYGDRIFLFHSYYLNGDKYFLAVVNAKTGTKIGQKTLSSSGNFPSNTSLFFFTQHTSDTFRYATSSHSSMGVTVLNMSTLNEGSSLTYGGDGTDEGNVTVGALIDHEDVFKVISNIAVYVTVHGDTLIRKTDEKGNTVISFISDDSTVATGVQRPVTNLRMCSYGNKIYVFYRKKNDVMLKIFNDKDLSVYKDETLISRSTVALYDLHIFDGVIYTAVVGSRVNTSEEFLRVIKYNTSNDKKTTFQLSPSESTNSKHTRVFVDGANIKVYNGKYIINIVDLEKQEELNSGTT